MFTVSAESTAGGFALWVRSGAFGALRNDDPRYTAAWTPYMTRYNQILSKYQISNGGNLIMAQIENEIGDQRTSSGAPNWPIIDYMVYVPRTFLSEIYIQSRLQGPAKQFARKWPQNSTIYERPEHEQ
jgi:hypothetical protein